MLVVPSRLMEEINAHVEEAYPEEGAGFLIGEEGRFGRSSPCQMRVRMERGTIGSCSRRRIISKPN